MYPGNRVVGGTSGYGGMVNYIVFSKCIGEFSKCVLTKFRNGDNMFKSRAKECDAQLKSGGAGIGRQARLRI